MQEKRDAFLSLLTDLTPGQRGATVNMFFQSHRDYNITDPTLLCRDVYTRARRALRYASEEQERHKWLTLLTAMRDHRETALGMAEWVVWWDGFSPAEKDAMRSDKVDEYKRAYMAEQRPTAKQLAYLRRLGHTAPVLTMLEASDLISQLVAEGAK